MSATNQSPKPKRMTIADLNSRLTEFMNSVRTRLDSIDERMNEMNRDKERISDLERQVKALSNQEKTAPTPAPSVPTDGASSTSSTQRTERRRNPNMDYLMGNVPVRRWVLLVILLFLAAALLAAAMGSRYVAEPATETVQAERGSIAINGNVTFHVYQDRADTNKSDEANAESETVVLLTRPLIEMNYNPDGSAETIITN